MRSVAQWAVLASIALAVVMMAGPARAQSRQPLVATVSTAQSVSIVPGASDELVLHTSLDAPRAHPYDWLGQTLRHLDGTFTERGLDTSLSFDVAKRRAHLQLGAFDNDLLGFGVDTDIKFAKGKATFFAAVDLGIAGKTVHLKLPEFSIVPRSYKGQRYIEYQIPVVRGHIDDLLLGLTDPGDLAKRLRFF